MMNNDPVEDIMNVYGNSCKGIHVPNPEQEFQQKCKQDSNNVLNKYFSKGNQQPVVEQIKPDVQTNHQVISEAQQRTNLLTEASVNLAKVLPLFQEARDKDYIKEIRDAIEDLMV
jgi:hypothetical protein